MAKVAFPGSDMPIQGESRTAILEGIRQALEGRPDDETWEIKDVEIPGKANFFHVKRNGEKLPAFEVPHFFIDNAPAEAGESDDARRTRAYRTSFAFWLGRNGIR
jgi:hypothetical protein